MQNSDPRDRIVYPIHKLMIDSYNPYDVADSRMISSSEPKVDWQRSETYMQSRFGKKFSILIISMFVNYSETLLWLQILYFSRQMFHIAIKTRLATSKWNRMAPRQINKNKCFKDWNQPKLKAHESSLWHGSRTDIRVTCTWVCGKIPSNL